MGCYCCTEQRVSSVSSYSSLSCNLHSRLRGEEYTCVLVLLFVLLLFQQGEYSLPEQFKSVWNGKTFVTTSSESLG